MLGAMATKSFDIFSFCILHTQTDRWLRTQIAAALKEVPLTAMEWLLLEAVDKEGRAGFTVTEAATLLGVSLPQVTALVHRLQRQGAITQQPSIEDGRNRCLQSTSKGQKLCIKANIRVGDALVEQLKQTSHLKSYIFQLQTISAT